MKVLLIDGQNMLLDLALTAIDEGHDVRIWQKPHDNGVRSRIGEGWLERVPDWRKHTNWADLILSSDNAKYMRELDAHRRRGYPIVNGHAEVASWESDRLKGQQMFEAAGIKTVPSLNFTKPNDAIAHVLKTGGRFVSKPNGDGDKVMTYVSKGPEDMLSMFDRWRDLGKLKGSFMLQEFIPGIEMAVSGWFGPRGFAPYWLENFEFKKLMNDDKGPNTGEQGTLIKYVTQSKLAREVLEPLAPMLHREDFVGFIDVNVIVDKKGTPWPMEFTSSRLGNPTFYMQHAMHPNSVTWMKDLVDGIDSFVPDTRICCGVVVAIPDYPYSKATGRETDGFPIWGITARNDKHVHLSDARMGDGWDSLNGKLKKVKMPVTAGDYVYIATGVGDSVQQAVQRAYKVTNEVRLSNSPLIRTDIGKRLERQLPELQKFGYAEEWVY